MPISYLRINNYMRVENVEFDPKGGLNEITGANGAGKTSTLSALATMGGKKEIAWKPIRDGAEEATIEIHVDGVGASTIRVIRKFWTDKNGKPAESLTVESADGARFPSPQNMMTSWLSAFTFDPLAFTRMDGKEQAEILKRFVPDFDFNAIDKKNREDFETRTDVNRSAKDLRARIGGILVPADTPDEPIDESALIEELQRAGDHNSDIEKRRANRQALQRDIERRGEDVGRARTQIEELKQKIAVIDESILADEGWISEQKARLAKAGELPAPIDQSDITAKINAARTINAHVTRKIERADLTKKVDATEAESVALTAAMDARKKEKAEAVRKAKMPVDGLEFGEDMVLFNGQPLDQASQAEKIRVSVAIAAAMSPKLKVAIIKDGSLLDKKSWALLEQFAIEHDLQVFVETVDSTRPTAIVIEDGSIRQEQALEAAE
ncbi:AAA family ATPase [Mesorhizobium sp. M0189]|uniref:ATP-binding protein n=1 Tax=Mesorhizobium sp. M0189 TaxID=2956909 RepID=UPI00333C8D42